MDTIISIKPVLAILVSLLAVIPIVLSKKNPNIREAWTFGAGAVKFLLIASK
jgi:multicomponent Na+:H+ antiporter subunit D